MNRVSAGAISTTLPRYMTTTREHEQPHHVEVVRHEQIAHPSRLAQIGQQPQDHGLNRNVERRGRFVQDQQRGLDRNGARDADARALAAGQLMRIALQQFSAANRQARPSHGRGWSMSAPSLQTKQPLQRIGDRLEDPERRVEAFGGVLEHDLDTAAGRAMRRETAPATSPVISSPSSRICPDVGSISRPSRRTMVDLPQPDSPTRPTLSPAPMVEVDIVDRVELGAARRPLDRIEFATATGLRAAAASQRKPAADDVSGRQLASRAAPARRRSADCRSHRPLKRHGGSALRKSGNWPGIDVRVSRRNSGTGVAASSWRV